MTVPKGSAYEIVDQIQSETRRLKIIHVGAGASGLLTAYKAERMLENYELVCYEKYYPLHKFLTRKYTNLLMGIQRLVVLGGRIDIQVGNLQLARSTAKAQFWGCSCDVPAHIYTYSFEPNPEWSGFYSFSSEIQEYFVKFYEKYKLQPYIRLNTTVNEATWNEEQGKCRRRMPLET
jgi:cation diffusion facilitator CzcD-associated flavoprotein CzcO